MMLRLSFGMDKAADDVERAVWSVLEAGHRTGDIAADRSKAIGTKEMGRLVCEALSGSAVSK